MRSNYKKLGPYIREVVEKNNDLAVQLLLGVSVSKEFIPSIANTIGTDMSTYKIVRENQFAYGPVTSRNSDKVSIALLNEETCIVSTSYTVFEIINHSELLPEYLMMWFRRPEFDRYARFKSHGSVRELFDWDEMCDVELPIPAIEKQREIVKGYHTIVDRIKLNEQLNQRLEETAQAIYKQWFVDFEFPLSAEYAAAIGKPELEGQSYKSSGGEMVYMEVLKQEVPKGWEDCLMSDFGPIITGKTPSSTTPHHFGTEISFITPTDYPNYFIHANGSARALSKAGANGLKNKILPEGSILVTCIGSDMGNSNYKSRVI
jgi:type I restriction enzyme S subunit